MADHTSSSSSTNTTHVYDIFLHQHGADEKKRVASHIYRGLTVRGLRVFLDQSELRKGEDIPHQIKEAIRTASVHVAIFSPTYARSRWCLEELALMVESGSTIIPVFHNVDPAELRWTRSGDVVKSQYARDLQMLEKKGTLDPDTNETKLRHDSSTLEKWRNALSVVSYKSGFDMNAYHGDEGQLVDEVVKEVWRKVPKTPLHVAEYATGLDEKIECLERIVLLQQQSQKTRVVGIVGLGGVGKTTLAKEFFNRHRSNYDRCCFVSDVRETAAKSSLISLQTSLLKDLAHLQDEQIRDTDESKEKLQKHISSCPPSLIVLDDVDHIDQLHALFSPFKDTIQSSGLILVTSRNRDVLTSSGIVEESIYQQTGLNRQHSAALFRSHAFDQSCLETGFEQLVEDFLDCCGGLPLSLKVIGAAIRGKDSEFWKSQLDKIRRILPTDIHSKLKISYDGLDKVEQEIFLDAACFFIGENRDTAVAIWNGSGWDGWLGLRNLEKRCLIEIDNEECIRMHDHLRDLGRDVAEKEHPLRISRPNVNLRTLYPSSPVRGISMDYGNGRELFLENVEGNCNLSRLELLRGEGSFVESVFSAGELRQLIYLRWANCPMSSISFTIPTRNLRVLYIEGKALKTLWQHESQAPLQLRELYIDATLSEVPESIGKLNQLERIVLKNGYFKSLPNEFYDMHSLKHITLQNCEQMMLLPDSVGILTSLQILDFSGCSSLECLPDSVGQLTGVQALDLNGCSSLQRLPDLLGDLVNLQNINLNGCSDLQRLPYSVGKLWNLQSIDLRGCSNLQMIPNYFGNLEGIERIDLSGCSGLHMLPNSFRNLKNLRHLNLSKCSNLEMLPYSFGNLRNLQYINLSKCSNLQMLPNSLENLKQLQYMNLSSCSNLQTLPNSFGNLRNLRHIDLSWCSNLQMLPSSFGNLTNLQHINLSGCSNLPILPNSFGNLIQLKHLYLGKCYELSISNETLGQIRTLEALEISGCYGIEVLPPQITNQRFLREMYLFCPFLRELPSAIGELSHLEILHLESSCLELLEMGELVSLEELQVRDCVNLKSIQGLAQLTKLRRLDVANCSGLKELSGVEHLMSLEELNAAGCPNLQWGSGVLEQLDKQLNGCIIE